MPKRISAEEAAKRGLVPVVEPAPVIKKISAAEAEARQMVPVEAPGGGDTSGQGYGVVAPGGKGPIDGISDWLRKQVSDAQSPDFVPSFGMGQTSNLLPRISATVDALGNLGDFEGEYDRSLKKLQPLYAGAVERHPFANVLGAVTQPNPVAKAGVVPRLLYSGAQGFVQGHEGAPVNDHTAQDAGGRMGAIEGVGAQAALSAIPAAGRFLAPIFREKANESAIQAIGSRAGITDRLRKMGVVTPEDRSALGRRFIDENLVPSGLNPFTSPLDETLERSRALMSKSGKDVGDILKKQDARTPFGPLPEGINRFDFDRAAGELRGKLPTPVVDGASIPRIDSAAAESVAGKAKGLADQIQRQQELTPGMFQGANKLKSDAYGSVNWAPEAPLGADLHRMGTSSLRQSIEDQVGEQLGPKTSAFLKSSNASYGTGADAANLAERAMSRDVQKQQYGPLRQAIMGVTGLAGMAGGISAVGPGGAGFAALGPAVTAAITSRGPNVMTKLNNNVSKLAAAAGRLSQIGTPASIAAATQRVQQATGETPENKDDVAKKFFLADGGF